MTQKPAENCGEIWEKLGLKQDADVETMTAMIIREIVSRPTIWHTKDLIVEAFRAIEQRGREAGRREVWERMHGNCAGNTMPNNGCAYCDFEHCPLLEVK